VLSFLMDPWFHNFVVLLHICAGLFWMGWIVFIFFLMVPVLRQQIPGHVETILPELKRRIRRVVFWLIMLIVASGLHNTYYNGLYHWDVLTDSAYGHRFLVKVGATLVLFGVYFTAPYLTSLPADENKRQTKYVVGVLHVIAFSAGILAAFLGLGLGP